jgi:acetyl esterase/lipase
MRLSSWSSRHAQFIAIAFVLNAVVVWTGWAQLLTWRQVIERPLPQPDTVLSYGNLPFQFGELWLPRSTPGPHPVLLLIHGGCWLAELPGTDLMAEMADAFRREGVAVWSIEYRRVGHPGGGYPGTFLDVANAADFLRVLAPEFKLDLNRVVAAGHSAGGHLALWLAGRTHLPRSSPLRIGEPLTIRAVVSIAGIGDPEHFDPGGAVCGNGTVAKLVDLEGRGAPEAYLDTSPVELLPLGVPQVIIHGVYDAQVPPFYGYRYWERASSRGDAVELRTIDDAGHFEVIAPWTSPFSEVRDVLRELLK